MGNAFNRVHAVISKEYVQYVTETINIERPDRELSKRIQKKSQKTNIKKYVKTIPVLREKTQR